MNKTDIASLRYDELKAFIKENGLPEYRAEQIYKWISSGVFKFSEMTNIGKALTEKLEAIAFLPTLDVVKKSESSDGTVKYLFSLHDGQLIETVVMNYKHGNSVCISSQVGCKMNCAFCASSLKGFTRDLSAGEMLAQVAYVNKEHGVSSIVIMGIGEPFDNFDNIMRFLDNIKNPKGMGLSHRHCSVSTCGIVPKIYELSVPETQLTLSVSLHAPDNETRNKIMPVNKVWDIGELMTACRHFTQITGRRISFEYTLIDGLNDTPAHAEKLANLLKGMLAHINLIPVNYVSERGLNPSNKAKVKQFYDILKSKGMNVTVRRTLGDEINAACGQLRNISS